MFGNLKQLPIKACGAGGQNKAQGESPGDAGAWFTQAERAAAQQLPRAFALGFNLAPAARIESGISKHALGI
jgi:hypothetical protein